MSFVPQLIFGFQQMNHKGKKLKNEKSISESLDEIIELKKTENSALKKIFDSLNKPKEKKSVKKK